MIPIEWTQSLFGIIWYRLWTVAHLPRIYLSKMAIVQGYFRLPLISNAVLRPLSINAYAGLSASSTSNGWAALAWPARAHSAWRAWECYVVVVLLGIQRTMMVDSGIESIMTHPLQTSDCFKVKMSDRHRCIFILLSSRQTPIFMCNHSWIKTSCKLNPARYFSPLNGTLLGSFCGPVAPNAYCHHPGSPRVAVRFNCFKSSRYWSKATPDPSAFRSFPKIWYPNPIPLSQNHSPVLGLQKRTNPIHIQYQMRVSWGKEDVEGIARSNCSTENNWPPVAHHNWYIPYQQ